MDAGNMVEAYETFLSLDGYKDSADKADSARAKYETEKIKSAKVGDNVFFGAYEQDNDTSNGKEDIECAGCKGRQGFADQQIRAGL